MSTCWVPRVAHQYGTAAQGEIQTAVAHATENATASFGFADWSNLEGCRDFIQPSAHVFVERGQCRCGASDGGSEADTQIRSIGRNGPKSTAKSGTSPKCSTGDIQSVKNEVVNLQRRRAEQFGELQNELRLSRAEAAPCRKYSQVSTKKSSAELILVAKAELPFGKAVGEL